MYIVAFGSRSDLLKFKLVQLRGKLMVFACRKDMDRKDVDRKREGPKE